MRCDEFERRLQQLLDAREIPSVASDVAHHAAECDSCRSLLSVETHVADLIDGAFLDPPSDGFADRVVASYQAEQRPSQTPRRPARSGRWLSWVSVTAAATLGVGLWFGLPPDREPVRRQTRPNQTASQPGAPTPSARPEHDIQVIDPAPVAKRLADIASERLPEADDLAVAVVSNFSPWARPLSTALSAIHEKLSVNDRADNAQPRRDGRESQQPAVPN